ncbi:hypothetical protein BC835DRAFT_1422284 [Cytidiella melzeri]|nr:hypothetical protein BC835DRAFT_1422284 [Cytidiella melzeri]
MLSAKKTAVESDSLLSDELDICVVVSDDSEDDYPKILHLDMPEDGTTLPPVLSYKDTGSPSRWLRPQRNITQGSVSSEASGLLSLQQQETRSARSTEVTLPQQGSFSSRSARTVASAGRSSASNNQEDVKTLREFAKSAQNGVYINPFTESPCCPSSFLFPPLHLRSSLPIPSSAPPSSNVNPLTVSTSSNEVKGARWRSLLLPSPDVLLALSSDGGYQYFVVAWGWQPGVYETWEKTREHCSSCPLAVYQGFMDPYVACVMWEEVVSEGSNFCVERGCPYPDWTVAEDIAPICVQDYQYLMSDVRPSRRYTVVFRSLFPGVYTLWLFAGPSVVGIAGALWRG